MTGQQIKDMLNSMIGGGGEKKEQPKTSDSLPDITTHPQFKLLVQEVNNIIAERDNSYKQQLAQLAQQTKGNGQNQPPSPPRPQYDKEAFLNGLEKDGISGLEYLFQTYYGYNPAQVIPQLYNTVNTLQQAIVQERQEKVFGKFFADNKDFNPSNPNAVRAMHSFMTTNNLPQTPDNLSAAWNFIKTKEPGLAAPVDNGVGNTNTSSSGRRSAPQPPQPQYINAPNNSMINPNSVPGLQLPPQFSAPGIPDLDTSSSDDTINRMQAMETFDKLSLADQRKFIDFAESNNLFGNSE